MTASASYIEWLIDALSPVGRITVRRMFGGAGVYCDGAFFAIIDNDQLFFKTDASGRAAFEAEGQGAFTYATKNGPAKLINYWQVPERLSDETDELVVWARRAITVARQGPRETPPKAKSKSATEQAEKQAEKKRGGKPRA